MKIKSYFPLLFFFFLGCQAVNAHVSGHGPVDKKTVITIAIDAAGQFASFDAGLGFGKLASSWELLSENDASIHISGDGYYIVSINNKTEGKILYVLMSVAGDIYDANFNGDFPRLR